MNTKRTYIERVVITCEREERDGVIADLEKGGFEVLQSGRVHKGPKFDPTRYKIIAEREIDKPSVAD